MIAELTIHFSNLINQLHQNTIMSNDKGQYLEGSKKFGSHANNYYCKAYANFDVWLTQSIEAS